MFKKNKVGVKIKKNLKKQNKGNLKSSDFYNVVYKLQYNYLDGKKN